MFFGAQVPLQLWQACNQLASVRNPYTSKLATQAAALIVSISGSLFRPNGKHSCRRVLAKLQQQFQQSGFLQQLPTMLSDAALQLQASAGIISQTDKVQLQDIQASLRGDWADQWAMLLLEMLDTPLFPEFRYDPDSFQGSHAGSMLAARCVLPAEHLVLASRQYLSKLRQDPQHRADPAGCPTNVQHALAEAIHRASFLCLKLVETSLVCSSRAQLQHSRPPSEARQRNSSPAAGVDAAEHIMHEAVRSRHHMECLASCAAVLHAALISRRHCTEAADTTAASTVLEGAPAAAAGVDAAVSQWLPFQLADQMPVTVQRVLQQLGCTGEAALWEAMGQSCMPMSEELINMYFVKVCWWLMDFHNHSNAFLMSHQPPVLTQPQLHDMQQLLHLFMLVPGMLLQWVADKPSTDSNYALCCDTACKTAMVLDRLHGSVLVLGPAAVYQQVNGTTRQDAREISIEFFLPDCVVESTVQLLQQLLPEVLQLWRCQLGLDEPQSGSTSSLLFNASSSLSLQTPATTPSTAPGGSLPSRNSNSSSQNSSHNNHTTEAHG